MPLAATLTSAEIYEGFKGPEKTFYYGHSYTGNALGCAAALASLDVFEESKVLDEVERKGSMIESGLCELPQVLEIRRVGLIIGFDVAPGTGKEVCQTLKEQGVLTRPILDTIVIMPPLVISEVEIEYLLNTLKVV